MALRVLRGLPVVYGATIGPGYGLTIEGDRSTIVGNVFLGEDTAIRMSNPPPTVFEVQVK